MALKCYYAPVYVNNVAPEDWPEGVRFQESRCPGVGAGPVREFTDIPGASYRLLTDEVYLVCDNRGGSQAQEGWTSTTMDEAMKTYPEAMAPEIAEAARKDAEDSLALGVVL